MNKPSIKIMGSVRVIQTGDGSFSISTQKNIQPINKDLYHALHLIEAGITQIRSDFNSGKQAPLSPSDMDGITESVAKCRSELAQREPNPVTIGSILAGISQSIQTTAALKPAYEAIKQCLSLLQIGG